MNKTKPASPAAGPPSSTGAATAVENAKKPSGRAPPTLAPRPTATSLLRASPHVALNSGKTSASAPTGEAQPQSSQASAPGGRAPSKATAASVSVMGIPQQPSASGRSMIDRSKATRTPPPSSTTAGAAPAASTSTGRAAGGVVPPSPARVAANRATAAASRAPTNSSAKPGASSPAAATTGGARFPSAMPAKSPGGARPGVGASSSLSVSTLTTRSPGGSISSKGSLSGLSGPSSSSTASKSSPVRTARTASASIAAASSSSAAAAASAANRTSSTAANSRRPATTPSAAGSTATAKASSVRTPTAAGRATSAPRPLVSARSSSASTTGVNTATNASTAAKSATGRATAGAATRTPVAASATKARTPAAGIASNSTARTPIVANNAANSSSSAAKSAAARARTPVAKTPTSAAANNAATGAASAGSKLTRKTPSTAAASGAAAVTTPVNNRSTVGKSVPATRATLMRSNANSNNVVVPSTNSANNARSGVGAVRPATSSAATAPARTPSAAKTPVATSSSAPGRPRGVATTTAGAGVVNTPKTPFAASSARSTSKTGAGVSGVMVTPSAVAANTVNVTANNTNNNTNTTTKRAAPSPLARTLSPPSLLSPPEREKERIIYSPSVIGGGGTGGRLSRTNSSQPEREPERKGLFFSPSSPSSPVRTAPENSNINAIATPTGRSSVRMETPLISQIVFDTSRSAAAAAMLHERDNEKEDESDDDSLQEEDLIIISDDLMLASIDELASSLSTRASLSAANNDSSSAIKGNVTSSSGKTDQDAVSEAEVDSLTTHAQTQISLEKEKETVALLPAEKEIERESDLLGSELDSGVNESKPTTEDPSSTIIEERKEEEKREGNAHEAEDKQENKEEENKREERSSSSETESDADEFSSSSSLPNINGSEDSMPAMGNVARMRQRFALERNPAAPPTILLHKGELELIRSHRISVKIVDITKQIAESQYNKDVDAITALRTQRIQKEAAEKETSESEEDPVSVPSVVHQQSRLLKNKFVEEDIKKAHSAASSPRQFLTAMHAPAATAHSAVIQPKAVSTKSDLSHRALPSVPVLASQRSAFSRNSSESSTHSSAKKQGQFLPSRDNSNSSVNNVVVSSSSSDSHAGGNNGVREEESEGKVAAVSAASVSSPSVPVSVSSSREEASGVTASSSTLTAAAASSVERERGEREFSSISASVDLGNTHTGTVAMHAPTAASTAIRSPPAFSHTPSPPRILNPTPSKLRTQGFSPIVISPGPAHAHPLLHSKAQHSQSFESSSGTVSELSGTSFLSGLSDTHTNTTATETDAEPFCVVPRLNLQRHHLLLMEDDEEKSTTAERQGEKDREGEESVFDVLSKSTLSSSVMGVGLVTAAELSLSPGRANAKTSGDISLPNQDPRQLSPSPTSPSQAQTDTVSLLPAVLPPPVMQRHLSVGEMSRLTDDDLFSQMDEQASVGIAERGMNNARSPREQQQTRVSFSPIIPPDALSGENSPANARARQHTHTHGRAHTHAHTLSQRQRERERETQQLEAEAERDREAEAFSHAQTYPASIETKGSEVSRYTRGHRMLQHFRKFDSERADHELTPLTRELKTMLPKIARTLASAGERFAERSCSSDRSPHALSSSSSSSHYLTQLSPLSPLSPLAQPALHVPRAFVDDVCEQWRCAHLQVATTETGVVLVAVLPLLEELEISLTPGGLLGRGLWQLQKKLSKPWHSNKAESVSVHGSVSVDSNNAFTQAPGPSQSLSISASVDDDASVFSHTQRTHTNMSNMSTANTCVFGGSVCVCDNAHGICENMNLCESGVKEHCGRYVYSLDDNAQDCESAARLFLLRDRERKREKKERRLSLTSMRFLPSFHSSRRYSSSQSYASPVASPFSPHHPLSREGLRSRVNERMTEEREKTSISNPNTPTNMGEKAEEKEEEKGRDPFVFFPQERVRDRERSHPPLALDGIEEREEHREEEKHEIEENPLFRHRRGIPAADANNNNINTKNANGPKSKSYSAVKVCIVAKRYVFPQEREKDRDAQTDKDKNSEKDTHTHTHSHSSRSGPTLEEKELRSEFNLAHWHASLCVARHVFHAYDKRTGVLAIFLDSSAVTASDFHTQKHKENHNENSNNNTPWGVGFFTNTLSAAFGVNNSSNGNDDGTKKRKKSTRTPVDEDDDEESVRSRTHAHGHNRSHNRSHAHNKRRSASSSSSLAGTHSHALTPTDDVEAIVRKGRYYFPADETESQRNSAAAQEVVPLTFTRSDTHTHAHKHAHALSSSQQAHTAHTAHHDSQSPASDAEPSLSPSLRIASKRQTTYSHSYDSDSVHSSRSQRTTTTHTHNNNNNNNNNAFTSSSNSKRDSQDSLRNRTFPRGFTDEREREKDRERERERDLAQRLSGNGSLSSTGSSGEREKDRERGRFSLDIEDRTTSPFQAVKGKKKTPQLLRHGSDGTLGSAGSGSETSSSHHM